MKAVKAAEGTAFQGCHQHTLAWYWSECVVHVYMLAHIFGVGEISLFVNIGSAGGVCLHWLCIVFSLSLNRRPWISEAQYSSFIKWDDAILLSLRLFCCLQVHHGWLSCLLAITVSSYLGGLGVESIVTCWNLLQGECWRMEPEVLRVTRVLGKWAVWEDGGLEDFPDLLVQWIL